MIDKQCFFCFAIKIWQCGGRLEMVPCSRVAHVFRQFRPYAAPDGKDTATINSARVAEVWLDEYKVILFADDWLHVKKYYFP